MNDKIKVLSLFDGMSVAQQALKELGKDVEVYYASEIDEYAKAVTQSNFPNTVQLGDTRCITRKEYSSIIMTLWGTAVCLKTEIDLLMGGSPCQDLSIAKKGREGLKGQRSGLFYEYVRIRDEMKPKYFILENVNSMPKEAKDTISEALGVQPVMINASLVSAQNRKRLFWIGSLQEDGTYKQVEISQPEDRGILLKDILESDVDEKWIMERPRTNKFSSNQTQSDSQEKANTLLVGGDTPTCFHNGQPRKFTDKEVLRLQSMPDDYFDKATYKNKPISNTQRYKMCGNAFNCEVVKHIIKQLDL